MHLSKRDYGVLESGAILILSAVDWMSTEKQTLALYRRRAFRKKVCASTVLRRAFDKAVRRKPPVVAADAGPMQIQLREGAGSRCGEAVRQSTTDDSGR